MFPLFVGLRYMRAKRRNQFISFTPLSSMLGIALGVTVLITVISVMNGFEKELRTRILGMASHVDIRATEQALEDWRGPMAYAEGFPGVKGAAPYVEGQGLLTRGSQVQGVLVRGIDPDLEPKVTELSAHMRRGRLQDLHARGYGILLGQDLADSLGAAVGDKVTLVTPQANVTPAGVLPRLRRFTVRGIFRIGMYEFDSSLALIHQRDAARLYRLGNGVTGVRLELNDLFRAPRLARELGKELGSGYVVTPWTQRHANFFGAVRTEKTVMFIILSLVVAVAAFNIVTTLVMVVTDKEADIAILRTMGATPGGILAIFLVQGTIIGVVGTLLGLAGGVLLANHVGAVVHAIEALFQVQFLPADVYYITELPSDPRWGDIVMVGGIALMLSLLATIYPARRAANVQPARALRYE